MKEVFSLEELQTLLEAGKKNYLLLFKSGSEASDCSYKAVELAATKVDGLNIFVADVSKVRDIHGFYGISSAPSLLEFEGKQFVKTTKGCNDADYYVSLFEDAVFVGKANGSGKPQKTVTVYSTPTCSWCTTLKTHLKKNGVRFTDIDVSKDQRAAENMVRRSGQQGVPQTDINGEMIVGFDKTRINSLLGIQ
ncbi:MAG TPA: glutaredoxin domain-containing protein [Bacteroidales bacterium]